MTDAGEGVAREMGVQPLDGVMEELGLSNHDLVAASTEQLTHKQVRKARRGRRLSVKVRRKVVRALNAATGRGYGPGEVFDY